MIVDGPLAVSQVSLTASPSCSQPGQPLAPTQVDLRQLPQATPQQTLDLGLADVHERREMVVAAAREMDAEELAIAEVGAADVPLHAALRHPLADAQPVPDLERLALHAERLRSLAGGRRMLLEQDDAEAALRQATGQGHADRSSPHHGDLGVERRHARDDRTPPGFRR